MSIQEKAFQDTVNYLEAEYLIFFTLKDTFSERLHFFSNEQFINRSILYLKCPQVILGNKSPLYPLMEP